VSSAGERGEEMKGATSLLSLHLLDIGGRPPGDVAGTPEPRIHRHPQRGDEGQSDAVTPSVDAMSYSAERRDEEVAIQSEVALVGEPVSQPPLRALLALTYLLCGESVEANEASIRRVTTAAEGRARR
jgi:hypothetical protein